MKKAVYSAPTKRAIELSLLQHNSTVQIAQRNHDIVSERLSKAMKSQNPAKSWSSKNFLTGSGYYIHNAEGYVAKLESLVVPSRPPPAERTAEDQPFVYIVPRGPDCVASTKVRSGSVLQFFLERAHKKMLMHHLIALEILKTQPSIEED